MNTGERAALCKRIMEEPSDSTFMAWLDRELVPPENDEDTMQKMMNQNLRELCFVFITQGHSGFSASYLRQQLNKLLAWEPLRPLTGADDEWNECGPGVFQNKRCSRVFKQADRFNGQAYDIEGKVFRDKDGGCFTNHESFVPVTFPYTPTTVVEDRHE